MHKAFNTANSNSDENADLNDIKNNLKPKLENSPEFSVSFVTESFILKECQNLKARLAGKYRWREFPAVITGNYRPGKYSKFWQNGKYWEIQNFRAV